MVITNQPQQRQMKIQYQPGSGRGTPKPRRGSVITIPVQRQGFDRQSKLVFQNGSVHLYSQAVPGALNRRRRAKGAYAATQTSGPGVLFAIRRVASIIVQAGQRRRNRGRVYQSPVQTIAQAFVIQLAIWRMPSTLVLTHRNLRPRRGGIINLPVQYAASIVPIVVAYMRSVLVLAKQRPRNRGKVLMAPTQTIAQSEILAGLVTRMASLLVLTRRSVRPRRGGVIWIPNQYAASFVTVVVNYMRSIVVQARPTLKRRGLVLAPPVQFLAAQGIFNATVKRMASVLVLARQRPRTRGFVLSLPVQVSAGIPIIVSYMRPIIVQAKRGIYRAHYGITIAHYGPLAQDQIDYSAHLVKPTLTLTRRSVRPRRGGVIAPSVIAAAVVPPIVAYMRSIVISAALMTPRIRRMRGPHMVSWQRGIVATVIDFLVRGGGGHGVFMDFDAHWNRFKDEQIDHFKNRFENKPRRRLK